MFDILCIIITDNSWDRDSIIPNAFSICFMWWFPTNVCDGCVLIVSTGTCLFDMAIAKRTLPNDSDTDEVRYSSLIHSNTFPKQESDTPLRFPRLWLTNLVKIKQEGIFPFETMFVHHSSFQGDDTDQRLTTKPVNHWGSREVIDCLGKEHSNTSLPGVWRWTFHGL